MMSLASLTDWLRCRRRGLEDALVASGKTHTLSLARHRLHIALSHAISQHAHGDCLDAGSGRSPYKKLLLDAGDRVTSIDVEDRSGETDIIADAQDMPQIGDSTFDTVLCSQVLEHVPRPKHAMQEFARVLKPGGVLILTVPHLSVIHEAPHDYFRYTRFGLGTMAEEAGLKVVRIRETGGLFCFLLHGVSALLLSTLGSVPLLRWPTWLLNYLLFVVFGNVADRLFGFRSLYPCDYLMVSEKPR